MFGRKRTLAVAGIVAALVLGGCGGKGSAGAQDNGLVVHTGAGAIRGVADSTVHRFQGVPYAKPPLGALRWAPPQPPAPWPGVREAAKPGPVCPQAAGSPGAQPSTDEDCLYLNVTTPQRAGAGRPVMVWLHGGDGTGSGADYDPQRMAAQGNAVVVTVNFRLGALSNFAVPQLGAGGGDFGLQDQLAALRWVRDNASAFGGDAHNVTVFGESSGAFATCALLSSPRSAGLVDKAIMESSSCSAYFPKNALAPGLGAHTLFAPLDQVQAEGSAAAAKLGCAKTPDVLGCLRRLPVKALLDGGYTEVFSAMAYGNDVLPKSPATAMRAGRTLPVPVLFGVNRDELRLYVASAMASGLPFDAGTYQHLLAGTYGHNAGRVFASYPANGSGKYAPALAWAQATTDNGWGCPTAADAKALSGRRQPVYSYLFADENAPNTQGYPIPPGFPLGAAHGLELASLFGPASGSPAQRQLADTMIGYWTNFARTGDPNGKGLPSWAAFREGGQLQQLAPGAIKPVDPNSQFRCALWNAIAP